MDDIEFAQAQLTEAEYARIQRQAAIMNSCLEVDSLDPVIISSPAPRYLPNPKQTPLKRALTGGQDRYSITSFDQRLCKSTYFCGRASRG
jgi:hypothetical protein